MMTYKPNKLGQYSNTEWILPWPSAWLATQICINIHPDAVPPIHAESYHVATDKGPLQVPVYF